MSVVRAFRLESPQKAIRLITSLLDRSKEFGVRDSNCDRRNLHISRNGIILSYTHLSLEGERNTGERLIKKEWRVER